MSIKLRIDDPERKKQTDKKTQKTLSSMVFKMLCLLSWDAFSDVFLT